MDMTKGTTFHLWLLEKYLEFQRDLQHPGSVTDFAEHLQVDRTVLSQLLWGKRQPTDNVLDRLSAVYKDEIQQFRTYQSDQTITLAIKNRLNGLSPEEKKEFLNQLIENVAE